MDECYVAHGCDMSLCVCVGGVGRWVNAWLARVSERVYAYIHSECVAEVHEIHVQLELKETRSGKPLKFPLQSPS